MSDVGPLINVQCRILMNHPHMKRVYYTYGVSFINFSYEEGCDLSVHSILICRGCVRIRNEGDRRGFTIQVGGWLRPARK